MTPAFVKINAFIQALEDDEIIRASDQQLSDAELKKDKNIGFDNNKGATHLYVRSGFFSKLRQVLTSRTDGAMKKQNKAKDLIIDALNSLPKELKNDNSVKNAFENIKQTLTSNDVKDFTAGMIKEHLNTINAALILRNRTAEMVSGVAKNNASPKPVAASPAPVVLSPTSVAVSPTVVAASPKVEEYESPNGSEESLKTYTNDEEISNGGDDPLEFESYFSLFGVGSGDNSAKKIVPNLATKETNNKTEETSDSAYSNEEIPDGDDALSEVVSGSDSDDEDGAVSSSESELPANETSSDPVVNGKPAEDTNSSLAESAPTINTTPAPIGEAIEQGMDAAEVATKSTPSPAPTARTSTAEAKSTETANRYLESLKSKWSANENGYFEVSNPFYITSEMPTSKMLSQAYLLPEGKQLEFFGKKGEPSKLSGNRIMHGEHELRDDLDLTNEKRGTRPYLKLEVKLESKPFQSSTKVAQNPAVLRLAEEYQKSLITIYTDSVQKISDEYKKTNPGKELETLVIAPITSTDGILLEVESTALVTAIKEIQHSNPGLKIAISADKEAHSDAIRAAYEK